MNWTEIDEIKSLPRATMDIRGCAVLVHVYPNFEQNPAMDNTPGKRAYVLSSEQLPAIQDMIEELPVALSIGDTRIYVFITPERMLSYA